MEKSIELEKLSLTYDHYFKKYKLVIYDKFGHYIDETELTREDLNDLYSELGKFIGK